MTNDMSKYVLNWRRKRSIPLYIHRWLAGHDDWYFIGYDHWYDIRNDC